MSVQLKPLLSVLFLALASVNAVGQKSGYTVLKSYPIASAGGWDYIALSPTTNNLYVSHSTQVNILNKNTGDSVGVIPGTTGVHGIAFVPGLKKGYTSNGKLNNVTVFDLNSNTMLKQIETGENPDAIMYDSYTKLIYVCNGRSKDISVIDPNTDEVIKTIALGGKPETAVSDDAGLIYVNIEDKSEIKVIDTKTYEVAKTYKTGRGEEPSGLAIDTKTKRLFAGCDNKLLVVLNAENGKVVAELPIGDGCDGEVFDDDQKLIFSANGEGTLTAIKEVNKDKFEVVENIPTQKSARTLCLDPETHQIFLPAAEFLPQTAEEKGKRPGMKPGTFKVLVVGKK